MNAHENAGQENAQVRENAQIRENARCPCIIVIYKHRSTPTEEYREACFFNQMPTRTGLYLPHRHAEYVFIFSYTSVMLETS